MRPRRPRPGVCCPPMAARARKRSDGGEKRRGDPPKASPPRADRGKTGKEVRSVRTVHGTRVARSIVCSSCGTRDTIHFAPKDPAKVLCRRCAADLLGVQDPYRSVGSSLAFVCPACGRPASTSARPKEGEVLLCKDCSSGIESKQENKAKQATRLSGRVLRVRRS